MYRMTIALGALPNDGQSSVAHTIQGLDEVHHLFGTAENPDGEWIAIPT